MASSNTPRTARISSTSSSLSSYTTFSALPHSHFRTSLLRNQPSTAQSTFDWEINQQSLPVSLNPTVGDVQLQSLTISRNRCRPLRPLQQTPRISCQRDQRRSRPTSKSPPSSISHLNFTLTISLATGIFKKLSRPRPSGGDTIDAAAYDEATAELHALAAAPELGRVPFLVFGNKCDLDDKAGTRYQFSLSGCVLTFLKGGETFSVDAFGGGG